jgi:hypothetical protein
MPAEAFELDLVVAVGGARSDGRMAKLMQIPAGRVFLPERVGLAIRQPRMAVGGQIGAAGRASFTGGDEQRATVGWPRCFK